MRIATARLIRMTAVAKASKLLFKDLVQMLKQKIGIVLWAISLKTVRISRVKYRLLSSWTKLITQINSGNN